MADSLPAKEDVAQALLLQGSLFVHLDPRHSGVKVPSWLSQQPQLVLQVGLDMPVPIPDLKVDGRGVFGTLSFNRSPFVCEVPWAAVFALVGDDGRGMVWAESMPPEISEEIEREAGRRPPVQIVTESEGEGEEGGTAAATEHSEPPSMSAARSPDEAPTQGKRPLPPYLRVVK